MHDTVYCQRVGNVPRPEGSPAKTRATNSSVKAKIES